MHSRWTVDDPINHQGPAPSPGTTRVLWSYLQNLGGKREGSVEEPLQVLKGSQQNTLLNSEHLGLDVFLPHCDGLEGSLFWFSLVFFVFFSFFGFSGFLWFCRVSLVFLWLSGRRSGRQAPRPT